MRVDREALALARLEVYADDKRAEHIGPLVRAYLDLTDDYERAQVAFRADLRIALKLANAARARPGSS